MWALNTYRIVFGPSENNRPDYIRTFTAEKENRQRWEFTEKGAYYHWYEDLEVQRLNFLEEIKSFSAYVNRQQWQDPTYGTKDNPVPIFFKRALSGHETLDMDDFITIKPSVNKKFVELYLAHELSSKEFNRLYGEDMKRLGLTD